MYRNYQHNRQGFRNNHQGISSHPQRANPQARSYNAPPVQSPQPYPQNHRLATSLFYFTLNRLEKHIERFFTRYRDFYLEERRFQEYEAISDNSVHQLAGQLQTQHGMEQAAVIIMCDNYTRINLPQSSAARENLKGWAEYLYAHLNPSVVPTPDQQRYEQQMMEKTHNTSEELWLAFRAFNRDPVSWGNDWAYRQAVNVYEQLERIGDAAHHKWLLANQPHRVPPAKPISKLRPEAEIFDPQAKPQSSQGTEKESAAQLISASETTMETINPDSGYNSPSESSLSEEQKLEIEAKEKIMTPSSSPPIPEYGAQQSLDEHVGDVHEPPPKAESSPESATAASVTVLFENVEAMDATQHSLNVESTGIRSRRSSMEGNQCFVKTIIMFSHSERQIPVNAILDTGAEGGNWVSKELINQLGLDHRISQCPTRKSASHFVDASGCPINGSSCIKLSWMWFSEDKNKYTKWHESEFCILPSNHIQVLFGTDYIREHKLIQFNEWAALTPLTANRPITLSISQQVAANKRAREAKRNSSKNNHSTPAPGTHKTNPSPGISNNSVESSK